MERTEIKDLLKKKDLSKLNSFILKNNKKKQVNCDLMNLLQTWAHCLLYYKKIYQQSSFAQRTILGVTVFVATSKPLKDYLDEFFEKIKPQLKHLNDIQILILSDQNQILEINTLHIEELFNENIANESEEELISENTVQKQIQFKSFLLDLKERFQKGFVKNNKERVSFKFRIGYRLEQSSNKNSNFIRDGWVKRENMVMRGEILGSLKTQKLNLIYQIIK